MRDLLLSVPTRGQIQWATVTRLEELRDRYPGMAPILYQPGNLSVAQTRNRIVQKFLAGPWQALAMVDDDVVPPPYFLELRQHLSEFGMVASPHPMPDPRDPSRLRLSVFHAAGEGVEFSDIADGVHDCDAVATGSVIISREAILALGSAPFRIADDPSETVVSDDFLFCADLRAHGFRVGYEVRDGWFSDHHSAVSLAPLIEKELQLA